MYLLAQRELLNLVFLATKELTNIVSILLGESCISLLLSPYLCEFGLLVLIGSYGLIYTYFSCSYDWYLVLTSGFSCTGGLAVRQPELHVEPTI